MRHFIALLGIISCLTGNSWAQVSTSFLIKNDSTEARLTPTGARNCAQLALKCIQQEYPNKTSHLIMNESENVAPHDLHSVFYGCLDWHSSVHGHWMLVKLLKSFPTLSNRDTIRTLLNQQFTATKLQQEASYFQRKGAASFERMYGWAWLLKLDQELGTWEEDADAQRWHKALQPLTQIIVQRYLEFLPKQTYPIRSGVHPNTAFGSTFALDYARFAHHGALEMLIIERSKFYFEQDSECPAGWEPSGSDFFSPCLEEADLMRRVLNADDFKWWMRNFITTGGWQNLQTPAIVSDRKDYQIVHLDGLNLSRAWCMSAIADALPENHVLHSPLKKAAVRHWAATLPHILNNGYEGEHWLGSFAVLGLLK